MQAEATICKKVVLRNTKSFTDWYLYAIHHKGYLLWKGETRKHHYTFDDVVGSDLMLLHELTSEADMSKYRCYEFIFLAAERKIKFSSLVADGVVPLHLINQFRTLYECILEDGTFRGGRVSHFELNDGDLGPFK